MTNMNRESWVTRLSGYLISLIFIFLLYTIVFIPLSYFVVCTVINSYLPLYFLCVSIICGIIVTYLSAYLMKSFKYISLNKEIILSLIGLTLAFFLFINFYFVFLNLVKNDSFSVSNFINNFITVISSIKSIILAYIVYQNGAKVFTLIGMCYFCFFVIIYRLLAWLKPKL
jgi:hypothetical protein